MLDANAVLDLLNDYLEGRTGRAELHRQVVAASWDIDLLPDRVAAELLGKLNLAFAEFTSGHLDSAEFDAILRELIASVQYPARSETA